MFTMSEEGNPASSRRQSSPGRPSSPAVTSDSSNTEYRMNTAGRYQSRRVSSHAFDPLGDQAALQVHTQPRRDSMSMASSTGRRRSVAVTGLHVEVSQVRAAGSDHTSEGGEASSPDLTAKLQAALHGSRQRRSFLDAVKSQLSGEQHHQLLQAHGDIVTRSIPPQLTLELYREVTPVMASCVKTYMRSLGSNHELTAECVQRHQECVRRLRQLEVMHATPEEGGEVTTA